MTEHSRQAWTRPLPPSSSSSSADHPANAIVPEQSVRATDFPALGTVGPSKAAARKRAVYALRGTSFDAYPPRSEVLARRQLEQEQQQLIEWRTHRRGVASTDAITNEEDEHQPDAEMTSVRQQSGMSSVVFYDKSGKRVNGGPAIYGKAGSRSADAMTTQEADNAVKGAKLCHYDLADFEGSPNLQATAPLSLPQPMTIHRIDDLMRETQRAQRARAARHRQSDSRSAEKRNEMDTDVDEHPLINQLSKSLLSVAGFLAAFGTSVVSTKQSDTSQHRSEASRSARGFT